MIILKMWWIYRGLSDSILFMQKFGIIIIENVSGALRMVSLQADTL